MRLVIILNLLIIANSCKDFWKNWKTLPCTAADTCYRSENGSYAEMFNKTAAVVCNNEPFDSDVLICSGVRNVENLKFTNCYLSGFNVGTVLPNEAIEEVFIKYNTHTNNFDSASFINMPSLKSVKVSGTRTSESIHLTFENVPSLTFLEITNYDFTVISHFTFRYLVNLSELRITKGKLKELPKDIFDGLTNVRILDLSFNYIENIYPSVFRCFNKLESLQLNDNKINDLPADLLNGLSNIKELHIYNNELTDISSEFLKGLQNLTIFYVYSCKLVTINEDLFSDAITLTEVNLSGNKIQDLPYKLFSNNKELKVFRCFSNEITTLPEGLFAGLSKLEFIGIGGNYLKSLPENIFYGLTSLRSLYLSQNRITFIPENTFLPLESLERINLSNNNLSEIPGLNPFGISENLNIIWMGKAGLKELPKINWKRHNLSTVDFSGNHFETVILPIYTKQSSRINLSFCKIKTVYIDSSNYGFSIPIYELGNNQITCDAELQQFLYAINSNLEVALRIFPDLVDMKCYGEERRILKDMPFYTIINPCPIKCECTRENQDTIVNCSGRAINKIPEIIIENATIVDLSNNNITEFSNMDYSSWRRVTHLNLSKNSLSKFPEDVLPPSIKYLSLQENHLTKLPRGLMEMIDGSSDFQISLSKNNFTCDCNSHFTKDWLIRNKKKILDFSVVLCRKKFESSFMEIVSSENCE